MNRQQIFKQKIREKILVLDGAMGTSIQASLKKEGKAPLSCSEELSLFYPEIIENIHLESIASGANLITTNSFGANHFSLAEHGLAAKTAEINKRSVLIAQKSRTKSGENVLIAGSVGPSSKLLNLSAGVTFQELFLVFKEQISALLTAGVDLILFETFTDTLNLKAAILALKDLKEDFPYIASIALENNGRMLTGQTALACYYSIKHLKPTAFGLNCTPGTTNDLKILRELEEHCSCPLSYHPNAGFPDENGNYPASENFLVEVFSQLTHTDRINIAGGCCGTTVKQIRKLADYLSKIEPKTPPEKKSFAYLTGNDFLKLEEVRKPLLVGERTNTSSSLKFKKLIRKGAFDKAAELAKKQILKGALVVDINLADTETSELENIKKFYPKVVKKIKTPVIIDSSAEPEVIEEALTYLQGRSIINSVSLEHPERMAKIVRLSQKYGAMLVVLLIDEQGMAVSLERKLEVVRKSYQILTNEYQVTPENIIFDTLVFPLASGSEDYYLAGKYSLEAITKLKEEFPLVKFSLGISNCSFGITGKGREVLNAVYLAEAVKSGLDIAIVNCEKLLDLEKLDKEIVLKAKHIVWNNKTEKVKEYISLFNNKEKSRRSKKALELKLEDELSHSVIEGLKSNVIKITKDLLKQISEAKIINEVLIPAMNIVGEKFKNHEYTLIDVLESASSMKEVMEFLEEKSSAKEFTRGRFVLATVKGDVHDIGKNLVNMIISGNGYQVIDLGTKVLNETIIKAVKKYKPLAVGLSGLLVQSTYEMLSFTKELAKAKLNIPLIVGGAALSENFVKYKLEPIYPGKVFYAKDALDGLKILNSLYHHKAKPKEIEVTRDSSEEDFELSEIDDSLVSQPKLAELFKYVNKQVLYGKYLNLKGNYQKLYESKDHNALLLTKKVAEVSKELLNSAKIHPLGVFKEFDSKVKGNNLELKRADGFTVSIEFPEDNNGILARLKGQDKVTLFCVTSGLKFTSMAKRYQDQKEFATSFVVSALGISLAEAFAEYLQKEKNLPGKRLSFGYKYCPSLAEHPKLFKLLNVSRLTGINLTENKMMNPENSVSGFIVCD